MQWYIFLFSPEMNDSLAERIIQCPALRQIDKPLRPNHFTHQVSAGAVLRLKFFRYLLPSFCGPAPLHELGSCAKDSLNLLRPALEMSYLRDKAIRVPPLRAAGLVLRSCSEEDAARKGGLGGSQVQRPRIRLHYFRTFPVQEPIGCDSQFPAQHRRSCLNDLVRPNDGVLRNHHHAIPDHKGVLVRLCDARLVPNDHTLAYARVLNR